MGKVVRVYFWKTTVSVQYDCNEQYMKWIKIHILENSVEKSSNKNKYKRDRMKKRKKD